MDRQLHRLQNDLPRIWQGPEGRQPRSQRQNRYHSSLVAFPRQRRQIRQSAHMPATACGSGHLQDEKKSQLRLLETRVSESGGRVGKLKRDEQPLFRSESPGFVKLMFRESIAKLTRTPGTFEGGSRSFQLHTTILPGKIQPVTMA